jgi:hypothetical protein
MISIPSSITLILGALVKPLPNPLKLLKLLIPRFGLPIPARVLFVLLSTVAAIDISWVVIAWDAIGFLSLSIDTRVVILSFRILFFRHYHVGVLYIIKGVTKFPLVIFGSRL